MDARKPTEGISSEGEEIGVPASESVSHEANAQEMGAWLKTEAAEAYDELKADRTRVLSGEQVKANLRRKHGL